jgi:hypothetical protein
VDVGGGDGGARLEDRLDLDVLAVRVAGGLVDDEAPAGDRVLERLPCADDGCASPGFRRVIWFDALSLLRPESARNEVNTTLGRGDPRVRVRKTAPD